MSSTCPRGHPWAAGNPTDACPVCTAGGPAVDSWAATSDGGVADELPPAPAAETTDLGAAAFARAADRPSGVEGPGTVIGPYKLLGADRRGRVRGRLHGRADSSPVRRTVALKVIKPGMDTRPGGRPVRGRAAGPGPDGPPEHRQGARRRRHRRPAGRTSSWSWSRACRSPSSATSDRLPAARPAGAVRRRLPGRPARPPEGDHPPRPQAVQRPGRPARRRAGGQGDRLRGGQGDRPAADRARRCSPASRRWSARRCT